MRNYRNACYTRDDDSPVVRSRTRDRVIPANREIARVGSSSSGRSSHFRIARCRLVDGLSIFFRNIRYFTGIYAYREIRYYIEQTETDNRDIGILEGSLLILNFVASRNARLLDGNAARLKITFV